MNSALENIKNKKIAVANEVFEGNLHRFIDGIKLFLSEHQQRDAGLENMRLTDVSFDKVCIQLIFKSWDPETGKSVANKQFRLSSNAGFNSDDVILISEARPERQKIIIAAAFNVMPFSVVRTFFKDYMGKELNGADIEVFGDDKAKRIEYYSEQAKIIIDNKFKKISSPQEPSFRVNATKVILTQERRQEENEAQIKRKLVEIKGYKSFSDLRLLNSYGFMGSLILELKHNAAELKNEKITMKYENQVPLSKKNAAIDGFISLILNSAPEHITSAIYKKFEIEAPNSTAENITKIREMMDTEKKRFKSRLKEGGEGHSL